MWAPDQWNVNKGKIVIRRSQSSTVAPCKRIQDSSWILDPIPWILDSGCWIPVFSSGTWILDSIPYSILESKALDSGFHKQNFPGFRIHKQKFSRFRNPDTLTWGEVQVKHFLTCSRIFN